MDEQHEPNSCATDQLATDPAATPAHRSPRPRRRSPDDHAEAVFEPDDVLEVFYGDVPRGARRHARRSTQNRDHRVHRPVGLRQDHGAALPQPHERPHPRRARRRQRSTYHGVDSTAPTSRRPRCAAASAWCSRSRTRSRRASTTTSRSARASTASRDRAKLDEIVEQSLRSAALWDEVKDRLKQVGARHVGRPAAAPVHRAHDRRRARGRADGRAVQRARSDRDRAHRGADARAQEAVHDRDRHAQHAAGRARQRPHRVLHRPMDEKTDKRTGVLVEYDRTERIFSNPRDERTENYITGRFG